MAKKGMKKPDLTNHRNDAPPVPEIQGKAKHTKTPAHPIIAGTTAPAQKVYHAKPHGAHFAPFDENDLAKDNLRNDIPAADLSDLP